MMGVVLARMVSLMLVVLTVLTMGCGRKTGPGPGEGNRADTATSVDTSQLAARVDGVPVYLEEVRGLVAASKDELDGGLEPQEALDVLVRNALLAAEARRRGFDRDPNLEETRRLALAKAILVEKVGEGVRPDTVDQTKLKKVYEANKSRFVHGPLRTVVHFLADTRGSKLSDDEARRIAESAREMAQGAKDESGFRERLAPLLDRHGSKVRIERLDPFDADSDRFVKPFVEATFEISGVGRLSPPVKTEFGWHVILVLEASPASNQTFDDVKAQLAEEVLPMAKKGAAAELVTTLRQQSDVFLYEDGLNEEREEP